MNSLLLRAAYWLVGRTPPPSDEDVLRAELESKAHDTRIRNAERDLAAVETLALPEKLLGGDSWYFDVDAGRYRHLETGLCISRERVEELEGLTDTSNVLHQTYDARTAPRHCRSRRSSLQAHQQLPPEGRVAGAPEERNLSSSLRHQHRRTRRESREHSRDRQHERDALTRRRTVGQAEIAKLMRAIKA